MKRVEDGEDGEISEPEDPLMLQRDAKDWKVIFLLPLRGGFNLYIRHGQFFIIVTNSAFRVRGKTITLCSVSQNIATVPPKLK